MEGPEPSHASRSSRRVTGNGERNNSGEIVGIIEGEIIGITEGGIIGLTDYLRTAHVISALPIEFNSRNRPGITLRAAK